MEAWYRRLVANLTATDNFFAATKQPSDPNASCSSYATQPFGS